MKLLVIFGTILEADKGGTAGSIAQVYGHKNKGDVHNRPIGSHAVFPCYGQQLIIIQGGNHRCRQHGHHIRGTISEGLEQYRQIQPGSGNLQQAAVFSGKIRQWRHAASHLPQGSRPCRTCHAPLQHYNKQHIQKHIDAAGQQRNLQAEVRFAGSDKKALKNILQHIEKLRCKKDSAVLHAVRLQLVIGTQNISNHRGKGITCQGKHHAYHRCRINQQGKILIGNPPLVLPQLLGNQGIPPFANHKADSHRHQVHRHHQIDRCKGHLAHIV